MPRSDLLPNHPTKQIIFGPDNALFEGPNPFGNKAARCVGIST
jgi:hypothetical protein